MISSHMKVTCYLHMWKDHHCYGYIINHAFCNDLVFHWYLHNKQNITWPLRDVKFLLSTLQEKFRISVRSCNILYLLFLFLGVEKNNDDSRKVLRQKSNNWDSPTNILQTETCLWALCKRERKPRAYNKKNEKYWNSDIKASRAKRRRISTQMKE